MSGLGPALDAGLTGDRRRFDQTARRLVAGECQRCGAQTWPRRAICFRCGSADVAEVLLPAQGRLTTWTRVWVPVEGLEPPYSVGVVELGRVQLFGHVRGVTDKTTVPVDVAARVDVGQQPPFWFEVSSP